MGENEVNTIILTSINENVHKINDMCLEKFPGEFENPLVINTIRKVRETGSALGKVGGIHIVEPNFDEVKEYVSAGFKFLGYGMDIRFLDSVCRQENSKLNLLK